MRGAGVLLMIQAHLFDSWIDAADRATPAYRTAMIVGGMGTVFFLFLAGIAVALSAGSKARRSGDAAAATRAVVRRGLEIFALAFVFRLQSWILGWSSDPVDLLKVDILNIMGPAIAASALLWRAGGSIGGRVALASAAALAAAFITPVLRGLPLDALPDPVQAYIVPVRGLSNFVFFPWIGFVFAGTLVGVLIDRTAAGPGEQRLTTRLAAAGGTLATGAYAASYLPSPFEHSSFWTSSPAFFLVRLGLIMVVTALAYRWIARARPGGWKPLVQLGRTSLFIYWIHVELVYGLVSLPLHRALSLPQAVLALVIFTAVMLGCSVAKERAAGRLRLAQAARRARGAAVSRYSGAGADTDRDRRRITS
jgi:uncharacterized membrane protein